MADRETGQELRADLNGPAGGEADLAPVVAGWDHEPGTINVREVAGLDGRPKVQLRLELGVIQMETVGRPDGLLPHGRASLLAHHMLRRARVDAADYRLDAAEADLVRREAAMYRQRMLALFVLEEYEDVVRDANHGLRLARLLREHAAAPADRRSLRADRPALLMMRARARAVLANDDPAAALEALRRGRRQVRRAIGGGRAWRDSAERLVLDAAERVLRERLPEDPAGRLQRALERAVRREQYERAAVLRDELDRLTAA